MIVFGDRDRNHVGKDASRALVEQLWKLRQRLWVRLAPMRIPEGGKGVECLNLLNAPNAEPRQATGNLSVPSPHHREPT